MLAGCGARAGSSGTFTTSIDLNALSGRAIPAGPWGSCAFSGPQRHEGLGDFVHTGGRCRANVYVFVVDPKVPVGIVDFGLVSDRALEAGQLKCYGPNRLAPAACDYAVRGRVVITLSTPTRVESMRLARRVAAMLERLPQGSTQRAAVLPAQTESSTSASARGRAD
jgi:metal-sulfur cluster biosynthetic enzyme